MCAMEFRNVRDRPHDGSADSGRPDGDAPGRAEAGTARTDQAGGNGRSDGPEQGGPGSGAAADAGSDAARLTQSAERTGAADRPEPGRAVHRPDRPDAMARPDAPARPAVRPERQKWVERLERAENRTGVSDQLKDRLNQLEPGNPSSPWLEDGTPRPPAPRLTDHERPLPTLSDTDYEAHVGVVKSELASAGERGLTTKELFTIDGKGMAWVAERRHEHDEIIREIYDAGAHVPCDHKAVIAGGLGGAGKTTVLEQHARIDRSNFLTINPDDIK